MSGRKARQIRREADAVFAVGLRDIDTLPICRELARLREADADPRRLLTGAGKRRIRLFRAELDRRDIDPAMWLPSHDWSTPQGE